MIPSFLIVFRETFEAALVIGIILAYLRKTGNTNYNRHIFVGAASGVAASLLTAYLLSSLSLEFKDAAEQLFEGTAMLIAVVLVTGMVLWMASQRDFLQRIRVQVRRGIDGKYGLGLLLLAFFAVYREGVEIMLFLGAIAFVANGGMLLGAVLGLLSSLFVSYLFFRASLRLDLRLFFSVTGAFLVLIAAGLFMHGIHEYQQAGILPFLKERAWDTSALLSDGAGFGGLLRSILGYNDNPSLLEVAGYFCYLFAAAYLWGKAANGIPGKKSL